MSSYKKYTNKDLIDIYESHKAYSGVVKDEELKTEIEARGGLEALVKFPKEINRIIHETNEFIKDRYTSEQIIKKIKSDILTASQMQAVISQQILVLNERERDQKITSKTIIGSLVGMILSIALSLIIWFISFFYLHYMPFILLPGMGILSYFIIKLFTKQSRDNVIVFIATFLSIVISFILQLFLAT